MAKGGTHEYWSPTRNKHQWSPSVETVGFVSDEVVWCCPIHMKWHRVLMVLPRHPRVVMLLVARSVCGRLARFPHRAAWIHSIVAV